MFSSSHPSELREHSPGNSDVAIPMLVVGTLGILARILSPLCIVEASLGAVLVVLALQIMLNDFMARSRARSRAPTS